MIKVHSYESMGTYDGPGLRLVVFLQGCPFRCLYCANPDTIPFEGGTPTEPDHVIQMAVNQKPFFGKKGGVTFSGGEPTAQAKELLPEQHFTQPPARYTEPTLIKALDENGIGRPSTYAQTMDTIKDRGYVVLEEKKFKPTEIGIETTDKLQEFFSSIVNVKYTAAMETDLDKIAENKADYLKVLDEANKYNGPSLIIAYAPCINHGLKKGMGKAQEEQENAVKCGYWHLWRYNPALEAEGKNPFSLDSKEPNWEGFKDFLKGEVRYASVMKQYPEEAEELFQAAEDNAKWRYNSYKRMEKQWAE